MLQIRVDWTIASELAWNGMDRTYALLGRPRIHDPKRFYLALDHTVDPGTLANDPRTRKLADLSRAFAKADNRRRQRSGSGGGNDRRVAVVPTNTGCAWGAMVRRTLDHRPSAPTSIEPRHHLARCARRLHAVIGLRCRHHLAAGAQLDARVAGHRRQQRRVEIAAMHGPVRRPMPCRQPRAERQARERDRCARRARQCTRLACVAAQSVGDTEASQDAHAVGSELDTSTLGLELRPTFQNHGATAGL
jgi:hypothetical protein